MVLRFLSGGHRILVHYYASHLQHCPSLKREDPSQESGNGDWSSFPSAVRRPISQEDGMARLLLVYCSRRDWRAATSVRPSARPPLLLPDQAHEYRAAPGKPRFRYTMLILTPVAQSYFHPTGCVLGQGPVRSSRPLVTTAVHSETDHAPHECLRPLYSPPHSSL